MKKGYLLVLSAGIAWGSAGVISSMLMDVGLSPFEVAWLRGAIALLVLFPIILLKEGGFPKIALPDLRFFIVFGLINFALFNIFYFKAIDLVGATMAVILLYMAPAFAVLFGYLFCNEPFTKGKIVAVILSILGCFLVVKGYELASLRLNLPGVLAGLGSGITYSLYGIFGKKAGKRYPALTTVFYCTLFGTLYLTIVVPPWQIAPNPAGMKFWLGAVGLGLWCSVAPWLAYNIGVRMVEASRAAVVASIEAVVGVALAVIFLGEALELLQVLGVLLVLVAVICAQAKETGSGNAHDEPASLPVLGQK
ncbi:MAG: DMT family transporter [bacterium]|jgi:DME family drug/metabolite transporter